ncbi:sulfatase [Candidatus Acetothermia bacterium]|jgi:arylsulfatase A-like enzyme|nr:sulfatase [Candidatus Acetothermia bacterium]MCI2436584.1 sulfatase [Candidatus Acetothermia bacterium]
MSFYRVLSAIVALGLIASFSGLLSPARSSIAQPSPPNIIFILTDDLDARSIEHMPKLKSLLIDQGLVLANFFTSFPLCCPSRATILRGQYAHNTKILGNRLPSGGFEKFHALGVENSTIATWLQSAGYRTMYVGKYLNGYPGGVARTFVPPGWSEWYSAVQGNAYGQYNYLLNENGKLVAYGNRPEDYGTDVYARKTVDFIQRMAKESQPFFVHLSVYAPHSPATAAPRHQNLFANAQAPRTPNFNEADVNDKPNHIRSRPLLTAREIALIDEEHRKRLQSLQAVDDAIEAMIVALKATGQLENTYIFFTSDNGFHLGNHRLMTGKIAPYEEDVRVGLFIRGPGVPAGQKLEHLAGNLDLAPTWAELAGAKAPDFVDGRSLAALWGSAPPSLESWRQALLLENGEMAPSNENEQEDLANTEIDPLLLEPDDLDDLWRLEQRAQAIPPYRAIRTQQYLYVEYATGERELYDLIKDPYQLENFVSRADAALLQSLSAQLAKLKTCAGASCRE